MYKVKKHCFSLAWVTLLLLFLFHSETKGQVSSGGIPPSIMYSVSEDRENVYKVDPPSKDNIIKEDERFPSPYRFGIVLPVDISIEKNGRWTDLPGGGRIWRVAVQVTGALALTAYFDRFHIPEGGKLFLYNNNKSQVIGAFTSKNNSGSGYFATELIYGDYLTLEYYRPSEDAPLPVIHMNEIAYAYRGISDPGFDNGDRGTAGKCEVNVNCPEGIDWQTQKKGVVRIEVKKGNGTFWCTGSVMNNTRYDLTPYVLTADHCGMYATAADFEKWIFYFNYEAPGCENTFNPPPPKSLTGAVVKAHGGNAGNTGSDFLLVLLNQSIPDSFNVYYNGWSRQDSSSPSGVCIHHPMGDVKKISTYTSPIQTSNWSGHSAPSHWKVTWSATLNGHGVTEGGSSGSPLFDKEGRIVGTETGGDSSCDSADLDKPDYYGKFAWHWDQNGSDSASRLMEWLDPDSTGVLFINGFKVGILEKHPEYALKVYPNPFHDVFTIEFDRPVTGFSVEMYDLMGTRIISRMIQPGGEKKITIRQDGLNPGLYFIRIQMNQQIQALKLLHLP